MAIIDHILYQAKTKIDNEKLTINVKRTKYINKIVKHIDKEQRRILLNTMPNKIRKKGKDKTVKNQC